MDTELEQGLAPDAAAFDTLEDLEVPGRTLAVFAPDGTRLSGQWPGLPDARGAGLREASYAVRSVGDRRGPLPPPLGAPPTR